MSNLDKHLQRMKEIQEQIKQLQVQLNKEREAISKLTFSTLAQQVVAEGYSKVVVPELKLDIMDSH